MKIILFSFLYEPELGGGAAVVVNQLARLLVKESYSVVVITTWKGDDVKTEHINGVKIIRIPALNLYWVAEKDEHSDLKKIFWQLWDIWNPLVYRLARQILNNEAPDIVHSHKLRGLSPSIWSAAASLDAKQIVHTCHDFEIMSPDGLLMGKIGQLAREQNFALRPYQLLRRHFSQLVGYVTAPSQFVLDLHREMLFFSQAKYKVIPNTHGFDGDYKKPPFFHAREKPRRFLYIGRLDKPKGIDLLCQAFSKFSMLNEDVILKVAGWGPLEDRLKEKFVNQRNIEFVGAVFGDKKVDLFSQSDVLIAPSIAPEAFGIVIAEAYYYGLPVIATKSGAYSEIVVDGETGILVEPGSENDFIEAFTRMTTGKGLALSMSRVCSNEAQNYTIEKTIGSYLSIYEV